jgi:hypothetical protein
MVTTARCTRADKNHPASQIPSRSILSTTYHKEVTMKVSEALGFVFEDEQWLSKLLLGAVISLIPIFGQAALTGYAIAVLRNVQAGSQRPLPSWDRLGEYFVDGLLFWIATLVYLIPFLILACPIALVWALPAAAGDNQDAMTALTSIAGLISAGLGCLSLLYAIVLWLVTPVLQIRFAETGELGSCLRFGQVFRFLFQHIGSIIVAQLLVWAATFVVTTVVGGVVGVLGLIPICGWVIGGLLGLVMIPVAVWVMVFAAHLYAQIGQRAATSVSFV